MTAASEARDQALKQDDALHWIAVISGSKSVFLLKRGRHLALEPTARGGYNHEVLDGLGALVNVNEWFIA